MRLALCGAAVAFCLSACGGFDDDPDGFGSFEGSCEEGQTTEEDAVTSVRLSKAVARVEYDTSGTKDPCFVEMEVIDRAIRLIPYAQNPSSQTDDLNPWCVEVEIPADSRGLPLLEEPYPKIVSHPFGEEDARDFLRTSKECVAVDLRETD